MENGAITGFYASIFALFYLNLGFRVVSLRRKHRQGIGDGKHSDLARAVRVHANANEYVPLTFLLLLCYELVGGNFWLLHCLGFLTLMSRVLHYFGLSAHSGKSFGRFYGAGLNYLIILSLSLLNIWVYVQILLER
jgi:uncharacterized protein